MNDRRSLMHLLVAVVREDLVSQRTLLARLEEQERAVLARDRAAMERATAEVGEAVEAAAVRAGRRRRALDAFATHLGVPAAAVSLGSIAERCGEEGARLGELRRELRQVASQVLRKNRRLAGLIRLHRQVTADVLERVLADELGNPVRERGVLVDAEA